MLITLVLAATLAGYQAVIPPVEVGVAIGCDGHFYYTTLDALLVEQDRDSMIDAVPITKAGTPLVVDEVSYDLGRDRLWGCVSSPSSPYSVYLIDYRTGDASYAFTSQTISAGDGLCDGLAYDPNDDTIWLSPDGSAVVDHYTTSGTLIGQTGIVAGNAAGVSPASMLTSGRLWAAVGASYQEIDESTGITLLTVPATLPDRTRIEGLETTQAGLLFAWWLRADGSASIEQVISPSDPDPIVIAGCP